MPNLTRLGGLTPSARQRSGAPRLLCGKAGYAAIAAKHGEPTEDHSVGGFASSTLENYLRRLYAMENCGPSLPSGPVPYIVQSKLSLSLYSVVILYLLSLPSGPGPSPVIVSVLPSLS